MDLDEEELKATRKLFQAHILKNYTKDNYISKDKIREKIKEVEEYVDKDSQNLWKEKEVKAWLNELLEENNEM